MPNQQNQGTRVDLEQILKTINIAVDTRYLITLSCNMFLVASAPYE